MDLKAKLAGYHREHELGRAALQNLDAQREEVMRTVLRLEGAMQALKDLADEEAKETADRSAVAPAAPKETPEG